jgi:U3 small nucleolar RNA-associated protein 14
MSADITLGKIGRVEHNYWFDVKCEHVTMINNEDYRRMQQRNHTHKAVEEYHMARREEKRVHKKRNKEYNECELKELEHLRNINESWALYKKLNKSQKDLQPRTTI